MFVEKRNPVLETHGITCFGIPKISTEKQLTDACQGKETAG